MPAAKEPSQTPAAIRARKERADKAAAKKAQQDGMYDPDAGAEDQPPEGRRGPGRPPGPRTLTRQQSIAALLGIANKPFAMLFPDDALQPAEISVLSNGLVKDPWTAPYVEKLVSVGRHSDLVEAIGMIVVARLVTHGVLSADMLLGMLSPDALMAVVQGDGGSGGSTPSNAGTPPAWDDPASVDGAPDWLRSPVDPATYAPPVPVGAG